jgi:NTE family protein
MSLWCRRKKSKDIDLVLSSSGVRAPCFIGGLAALEEKGYKIKRIAGSSGGAIVGAGYALGMSTAYMTQVAGTIPYDKFNDFHIKNLLSLSNPSVYSGRELDGFYQDLFGGAVLGDFEMDCKITVVTIAKRRRILLDRETHPHLPVWKAVRMSSTIPFIFPYLKLGDVPVTDGGLVIHMADIFPDSPRQVLGLRPRATNGVKKLIHTAESGNLLVWNYLKIVAEYLLDAVDNTHVPQDEWSKTIIIPTLDIGGFDFALEPEQINQLIAYGYDAVMASELVAK